ENEKETVLDSHQQKNNIFSVNNDEILDKIVLEEKNNNPIKKRNINSEFMASLDDLNAKKLMRRLGLVSRIHEPSIRFQNCYANQKANMTLYGKDGTFQQQQVEHCFQQYFREIKEKDREYKEKMFNKEHNYQAATLTLGMYAIVLYITAAKKSMNDIAKLTSLDGLDMLKRRRKEFEKFINASDDEKEEMIRKLNKEINGFEEKSDFSYQDFNKEIDKVKEEKLDKSVETITSIMKEHKVDSVYDLFENDTLDKVIPDEDKEEINKKVLQFQKEFANKLRNDSNFNFLNKDEKYRYVEELSNELSAERREQIFQELAEKFQDEKNNNNLEYSALLKTIPNIKLDISVIELEKLDNKEEIPNREEIVFKKVLEWLENNKETIVDYTKDDIQKKLLDNVVFDKELKITNIEKNKIAKNSAQRIFEQIEEFQARKNEYLNKNDNISFVEQTLYSYRARIQNIQEMKKDVKLVDKLLLETADTIMMIQNNKNFRLNLKVTKEFAQKTLDNFNEDNIKKNIEISNSIVFENFNKVISHSLINTDELTLTPNEKEQIKEEISKNINLFHKNIFNKIASGNFNKEEYFKEFQEYDFLNIDNDKINEQQRKQINDNLKDYIFKEISNEEYILNKIPDIFEANRTIKRIEQFDKELPEMNSQFGLKALHSQKNESMNSLNKLLDLSSRDLELNDNTSKEIKVIIENFKINIKNLKNTELTEKEKNLNIHHFIQKLQNELNNTSSQIDEKERKKIKAIVRKIKKIQKKINSIDNAKTKLEKDDRLQTDNKYYQKIIDDIKNNNSDYLRLSIELAPKLHKRNWTANGLQPKIINGTAKIIGKIASGTISVTDTTTLNKFDIKNKLQSEHFEEMITNCKFVKRAAGYSILNSMQNGLGKIRNSVNMKDGILTKRTLQDKLNPNRFDKINTQLSILDTYYMKKNNKINTKIENTNEKSYLDVREYLNETKINLKNNNDIVKYCVGKTLSTDCSFNQTAKVQKKLKVNIGTKQEPVYEFYKYHTMSVFKHSFDDSDIQNGYALIRMNKLAGNNINTFKKPNIQNIRSFVNLTKGERLNPKKIIDAKFDSFSELWFSICDLKEKQKQTQKLIDIKTKENLKVAYSSLSDEEKSNKLNEIHQDLFKRNFYAVEKNNLGAIFHYINTDKKLDINTDKIFKDSVFVNSAKEIEVKEKAIKLRNGIVKIWKLITKPMMKKNSKNTAEFLAKGTNINEELIEKELQKCYNDKKDSKEKNNGGYNKMGEQGSSKIKTFR
ncbi:hypothetical protein, partial [Campylobacter canadensis]|uniref:hypothetical protein n=1 Tax=Campylobacter canadensis TaxID=449520 RepID=UPI001CCB3EFF